MMAKEWCVDRVKDWTLDSRYVWSCRVSENSDLLRQATLLPRAVSFAIAYWVHPLYWGKGIATEMCIALFDHLGQSGYKIQIWAGVDTWNTRSESVLVKLGFELQVDSKEEVSCSLTKVYTLQLEVC